MKLSLMMGCSKVSESSTLVMVTLRGEVEGVFYKVEGVEGEARLEGEPPKDKTFHSDYLKSMAKWAIPQSVYFDQSSVASFIVPTELVRYLVPRSTIDVGV